MEKKRYGNQRQTLEVLFFLLENKIMKERKRPLYIEVETIITAGKLLGAIISILGVILAAHKWYLKQESLDEKISELEHKHVDDIKKIEEEACLHTYGILACLKGLQEKGCNGPVTEAIEKYEKYLNKRAHDQED